MVDSKRIWPSFFSIFLRFTSFHTLSWCRKTRHPGENPLWVIKLGLLMKLSSALYKHTRDPPWKVLSCTHHVHVRGIIIAYIQCIISLYYVPTYLVAVSARLMLIRLRKLNIIAIVWSFWVVKFLDVFTRVCERKTLHYPDILKAKNTYLSSVTMIE